MSSSTEDDRLAQLRALLSMPSLTEVRGRVRGSSHGLVRATLPDARVGDRAWIDRPQAHGGPLHCAVVALDLRGPRDAEIAEALLQPQADPTGVGLDDPVRLDRAPATPPTGVSFLGRVVDGAGRPLDGGAAIANLDTWPLDRRGPRALDRAPIRAQLHTGLAIVDALLPLAIGARMGLFSGPGLGKSTLLSTLARRCDVDVVVMALIGERGREVEETVRRIDRARTCVVASTVDAHPAERVRAALLATAIAERARDEGKRVLLLVDSLSRVARARRELALAAGEPVARVGYPSSVFEMLPKLVERAGNSASGSITAIYAVLVEGDEAHDPIAEEVRGLVDGHWVLDASIAARGRHPAIDPTRSIARTLDQIVPRDHADAAHRARAMLSLLADTRDLRQLGGWVPGVDARIDEAIARERSLEALVTLGAHAPADPSTIAAALQSAMKSG